MPQELQQEVINHVKLLVASNSSIENIEADLKRIECTCYTISAGVALGVYAENYEQFNSLYRRQYINGKYGYGQVAQLT